MKHVWGMCDKVVTWGGWKGICFFFTRNFSFLCHPAHVLSCMGPAFAYYEVYITDLYRTLQAVTWSEKMLHCRPTDKVHPFKVNIFTSDVKGFWLDFQVASFFISGLVFMPSQFYISFISPKHQEKSFVSDTLWKHLRKNEMSCIWVQ